MNRQRMREFVRPLKVNWICKEYANRLMRKIETYCVNTKLSTRIVEFSFSRIKSLNRIEPKKKKLRVFELL